MSERLSHLGRTAIPDNVLDRLRIVEIRLDDLEGMASLPTINPEAGEGETTYINIVQEVEIGEGPGTDVTGTSPNQTVGLGGDTILLYDSGGAPVAEFAATDAGLTAALAAATAGDVVELPAVTITGGPWTVANGTLRGHSRFGSVLDGQVTLSDGTEMENLTIRRTANDSTTIYGVVCPVAPGAACVTNCTIRVVQNGAGDGYGILSYGRGSLGTGSFAPGLVFSTVNGSTADIL